MQFIKNNWLSIVSLLIGLIGIYLGYYFYEESQSNREPSFLNSESAELFVSNDNIGTKNFTIISNKTGKPIKDKIYTQELTFWNNGKLSIRRENILKPLTIKYPEHVEILEANIIESSRNEITTPSITINNTENSISINFEILEQEDGVKIRTIYSGKSPENPKIDGAIESVKRISTNDDLQSNNIGYGIAETTKTIAITLLLIIGIGLLFSIPDILKKFFPVAISKIPTPIRKAASMIAPSIFILVVILGGGIKFYTSVIDHAKEGARNSIPKMAPAKY